MQRSFGLRFALLLIVAALVGCFLLISTSIFSQSIVSATYMGIPKTMFWAWERPEDLRFLQSDKQGVAFLASTIELWRMPVADAKVEPSSSSDIDWLGLRAAAKLGVRLVPRLQPLQVAKDAQLMAVVRIETTNDLWHRPAGRVDVNPSNPPATSFLYSEAQEEAVVNMVVAAARLPQVNALQIDFDAAQSERPFYTALLHEVRNRLPQSIRLSITALASWCIDDPWLDQLPPGTIDEAVPMLFRMGPDEAAVAAYLESGRDFRVHACRGSLGVSTDEGLSQAVLRGKIFPNRRSWATRRVYIFSPKPWIQKEASSLTSEVSQWHKD